MSERAHLVPPDVRACATPSSRVPFAFGRRFFLLLLIGLVWLGPAWRDARYVYAMFLWDVAVVLLWLWDLVSIPKPQQLEVRRSWTASIQLSAETGVRLEIQNSGAVTVFAEVLDDAPQSFRSDAPEMQISVPAGATGSAAYVVQPRERGDARIGDVFLRYQSPWHIAERWASAALSQTVRIK